MPSPESGDCYTREEVLVMVAAIDRRDRARFRIAAIRYAKNTRLEPDELLNEAILRTLSGERAWKRDIGLYGHLCGVMQSIRSFEFKHRKVVKELYGKIVGAINAFEETVIRYGAIGSSQRDSPDPHQILGSKQELLQLLKAEKLNAIDIRIIVGLACGYKRQELFTELAISPREYDTRLAFIRQALSKSREGES
jgi:hypothetical protein